MTPPEIKRILVPVNDPVGATGTPEEILNAFRKVSDEMKQKIKDLMLEKIQKYMDKPEIVWGGFTRCLNSRIWKYRLLDLWVRNFKNLFLKPFTDIFLYMRRISRQDLPDLLQENLILKG